MRGLIIGPSPGKGLGDPLSGQLGRKLVDLFGLKSERELDDLFDRMNLISYDTKAYKDGYPHGVARARASSLRRILSPGRVVVLLGKDVQRAFSVQGNDVGRIDVPDGPTYILIPHPSGLNRFWNSRENTRRAESMLRACLPTVRGGTE